MTAALLALALLAASPAPRAAPPDAGPAAVDAGPVATPRAVHAEAPPRASFGEPFPYTITVEHSRDEIYALPRTLDLEDFEVAETQKDDQPASAGVLTTFHLTLRGYGIGSKTIPTVSLEVTTTQGTTKVEVPGPAVELMGTMDPDGGAAVPLRDIAPPETLNVRSYRLLGWLAMLVGGAGLAYFLYKRVTKEKPVVPVVVPVIPPDVRAEEALTALLQKDLPGKDRQREFYFELSEIARRYLGERFDFAAIDLTTGELLAALRTRRTPGLSLVQFEAFCKDSDLAKFARYQPAASACKTHLDEVQQMVQATTVAAQLAAQQAAQIRASQPAQPKAKGGA